MLFVTCVAATRFYLKYLHQKKKTYKNDRSYNTIQNRKPHESPSNHFFPFSQPCDETETLILTILFLKKLFLLTKFIFGNYCTKTSFHDFMTIKQIEQSIWSPVGDHSSRFTQKGAHSGAQHI